MKEEGEAAVVETVESDDAAFEAEFEAARKADEAEGASPPAEAEGAASEGEANGAEAKPPLTPDELKQRNEDLKKATRVERLKRQEADKRAAALEARLAELEARVQAPAQNESERPNPQEDPIGYMEWLDKRLDEAASKSAEEQQKTQAQQKQQEVVRAVVSQVEEYENDFRATHADYDQAAEHLYTAKMGEYLDAGYEQNEAHNMVMAEFLTRSERALKTGKDPAEIVYSLAGRYGYGATKAEADAKKGEDAAKAKLEKIAEGQKATSPLAGAGGRGAEDLDMAAVLELDGAAFDAAFEKLMKKAQRAGHY